MKTVQELYDTYRIPPWLQLHQLRVAAVAHVISGHMPKPIHSDAVITACLLHDMGNIIKFDFAHLTDFAEQHGGIAYWRSVQDDFVAKYGNDEHRATLQIADEIGISSAAKDIMGSIGLGTVDQNIAEDRFEYKIAEYADMCVSPRDILSVRERQEDSRLRYRERMRARGLDPESHFDRLIEGGETLERQIFARCLLRPADVSKEANPLVAQLRQYEIA